VVKIEVRDYGLSELEQDELWRRWRDGQSVSSIGRELGKPFQHLRRFMAQTGGVRPPAPRPARWHLSLDEREEISRGIAAGQSSRAIAGRLGRRASTVSREVSRHGGREAYRAQAAHARATENRRRPKTAKLAGAPRLRAVVEAKLGLCWSPDEVRGWLELEYPDDPDMRVSHETIYRSLFDPRLHATDRTLTRKLRSGRPMRLPRKPRNSTGRGRIKNMVSIRDRPAEVEGRTVPGHWEGDLVMGRRPSAIATLVERTSRFTVLVALPGGFTAEVVTPRLINGLETIPAHLRRSLTWDRGREMARHEQVSAETGMPVYFCNPKSPWQRPSNENTNGLLRQYLAKSADLRVFTQADLDAIADELNDRPRRTHGYRSPTQVYGDLQASGAPTP